MSVERRDVVVVGGGVMGSAAAWQLARAGRSVTLLERFEPGHVHGASHGTARIFRLGYAHPAYIDLARESLRQWRELESVSATDLLTLTGGVEHGISLHLTAVAEGLAAAGLTDNRWLTAEEAQERWPIFRFETPVFYQPQMGRLHADRSVKALQDSAIAVGAEVRFGTPVRELRPLGATAAEVRTDDATYRAATVIVTAGAWTRSLLGAHLDLPPLRVTQEQPAHFTARTADADWPAFGHVVQPSTAAPESFQAGIYGLAAPGEGIKVGFHGTGPEVDPDARTYLPEPGQLAELQAYVRHWLPGVDADDVRPISCTYTSTRDANFILDRRGPIVVGAGFSGHGFKHAPAVGGILADLATTGARPDPVFAGLIG